MKNVDVFDIEQGEFWLVNKLSSSVKARFSSVLHFACTLGSTVGTEKSETSLSYDIYPNFIRCIMSYPYLASIGKNIILIPPNPE